MTAPSCATYVRRTLALAAVAALLGITIAVGWWALSGGRWYVVRTPSMGTAAPVGTLVWVKPVDPQSLKVGDIVSFRPPQDRVVYTHRIYSIDDLGHIRTKGDINALPDPWTISRTAVIGTVQHRWWAMGWVVRALPVLVVGGLLLGVGVHRWVRPARKLSTAIVGVAAILSVSIFWLRPLVRGFLVSSQPLAHGQARARFVSTGLLPVKVSAPKADTVHLVNGRVATLLLDQRAANGRLTANFNPDIRWWMWVLLVLTCLLPALWTSVFGARPSRRPTHSATA